MHCLNSEYSSSNDFISVDSEFRRVLVNTGLSSLKFAFHLLIRSSCFWMFTPISVYSDMIDLHYSLVRVLGKVSELLVLVDLVEYRLPQTQQVNRLVHVLQQSLQLNRSMLYFQLKQVLFFENHGIPVILVLHRLEQLELFFIREV